MNKKEKLRRAVFSLAICVGIFCAWCCVLLMAGEYNSASHKLDVHKQEVQGWEACRLTKPSYFRSNAEVVSSCLKNFNQAKNNFWLGLSKGQLVGLFALAALGSAVAGGLATWIVVWLGGLTIYKTIRLLVLCFRFRSSRQQVNS